LGRDGLEGGFQLSLSCSIGFCAFPLCTQRPAALDWHAAIDLADAALYEAKDVGRNAWVGLLGAEAADEAELRQDARRRLDEWTATGRLAMSTSKAAA
jgi:predicted signal transduction protein with EAL and GGDEF domain